MTFQTARCRICLLLVVFLALINTNANSQNILIDQGIQAGNLWCFPSYEDSLSYYYLPNKGRLVVGEDGLPAFSFIQYMLKKPTSNGVSTINEADGGGMLNFLFTYHTPQKDISAATNVLKEKLNNEKIILKSPISFSDARYNVISSVILTNKSEQIKLISSGNAPVFENSQIALSFPLDKLQSQLLLESFKSSLSDISITFELTFEGLSSPYNATLEVDWEKVYKSKLTGASANLYFVSADIENNFERLRKEEAIKLEQVGEHKPTEGLVNVAYNRLLDMLFEKIEPEKLPKEDKDKIADKIGSLFKNTIGKYFSVGVTYKKKNIRQSGKSKFYFKGRSSVKRTHYITFNLGNLYKEYGSDKRIFRNVPLWDPAFQERKVFLGIDRSLKEEMGNTLNGVTLNMRKIHANGKYTPGQYILEADRDTSWSYFNDQEKDLEKWMHYEYQTIWDFAGEEDNYITDWKSSNSAKINMVLPFRRKNMDIFGDKNILLEKEIKRVRVRITYPFIDGELAEKTIMIDPRKDFEGERIELMLLEGVQGVDYSIQWFSRDGIKELKGYDETGVLFIDELPK